MKATTKTAYTLTEEDIKRALALYIHQNGARGKVTAVSLRVGVVSSGAGINERDVHTITGTVEVESP